MQTKFKVFMTLLALGALFSVYSLTNSLRSNIASTLPAPLRASLPLGIEADADHDGLSNTDESYWATEWQNSDTDGDGFLDGEEVASGHDPRKAGPDDLLAKTNGFLKPTENITDKLSSLITAGLYAGDLKKSSSKQKYTSAINSLSLSVLDDSYIALNLPTENIPLFVSDSKENQEKYLSDIVHIYETKIMNGALFAPIKLSVFASKIGDADPQKVKAISIDLLSEAMNFKINADIIEKLPVPASWKGLHAEILNTIRSLALGYQAIGNFNTDPIKGMVAIKNIEDVYSGASKLLIRIAQKAKTNNLKVKGSQFWNLVSAVSNEL